MDGSTRRPVARISKTGWRVASGQRIGAALTGVVLIVTLASPVILASATSANAHVMHAIVAFSPKSRTTLPSRTTWRPETAVITMAGPVVTAIIATDA